MRGWGAIDWDKYGLNLSEIAAEIERVVPLPMVVVRSKSGGAHLYLFMYEWEEVPAALMREALEIIHKMLCEKFGLPEQIEVFPKQVEHREAKYTNWINMPYRHDTRTYCVLPDGQELSWPEFLEYASKHSIVAEWLEEFVEKAKSAGKHKKKEKGTEEGPGGGASGRRERR